MTGDDVSPQWDEDTSKQFLDYGKYFIPARQEQMQMMVDLLRAVPHPALVLELCCGEGLLAELLLDTLPHVTYWGLDGSSVMLEKAGLRLSRFGSRARLTSFELQEKVWRTVDSPLHAVVTSLAIHHLDAAGKQQLFNDVHAMLAPAGAFIISDMIEPVSPPGRQLAAVAWDEVVRQRSLTLDGNTQGLDFFQREHWNTFRFPDPQDIDYPSPLFDQLKWLAQAGFINIDVHFMQAGHALFSGWKPSE